MNARRGLLFALAATLAGCSEPDGVRPSAVSADRSYMLASCISIGAPTSKPPCGVNYTPSNHQYLDSARIVLKADGSYFWVGTVHDDSCSEVDGTCVSLPATRDTITGRYEINGDTLAFDISRDTKFGPGESTELKVRVPADARAPWAGPDSLVVSHYQPNLMTVYRPQ